MKVLVVVDMQHDFISGALGTIEAKSIVPAVQVKVRTALRDGTRVVFTRDTHTEEYLNTQEGKNLPVPHCIIGTDGWQIDDRLYVSGCPVFDKPSFGSTELIRFLTMMPNLEAVEFVGLCTDICVITNVMMLKGALPEVPISVDSTCCAGVTPATHDAALKTMAMCQIGIL